MTGVSVRVKGALVVLASCVVLGGCGSGSDDAASDEQASAAPSAETSTSDPTPTAEPVTMIEACPEVEAVLPGGFIPGFGKMSTYVDRLNELNDQGDVETQNALALLIPEATDLMLAVARDARGSELTTPLSAHLDGLSAFANRCKAAGSSALQ